MKNKKYLFKNSIICIALAIFAASCANDETTVFPENRGLTSFSGSMNSETPVTRALLGEYGISEDVLSRSSMGRDSLKAAGVFYWESGDCIYVQDDKGTWTQSTDRVDQKTDQYVFHLNGTFSENGTYTILYKGSNANADDKVTIAETQKQLEFNNTAHFGVSGDCAVGTAKRSTSGYEFSLEHKASYLCFLPYVPDANKAAVCKLKKIIVSSGENVAGEYSISSAGLNGSTQDKKSITIEVGNNGEGISLKDVTQADITKSLYMVIAPGTHNLQAKYVVFDESTNKEDTITKKYNSNKELLSASKIYNVPVDLSAGISGRYSEKDLENMTYNFKLIFHFLQNDQTNSLSSVHTADVQAIVDEINKYYAGNGSTTNANVKFELADSMANNMTDKGITRTTVTEDSISYKNLINETPGDKFYNIGWDRSKYINVYVYTTKENSIGGVTTMPKMPRAVVETQNGELPAYSNAYTAYNVSITLNAYILRDWMRYKLNRSVLFAYPALFADTNPVNVLSHELGHYLGLYHSYHSATENPGHDYCDDTKEYDRDEYMKTYQEFIPKLNEAKTVQEFEAVADTLFWRRAISGNSVFRSDNIMDYFFSKANKFTPDQVKRMRRHFYYSTTIPGPKVYLGTRASRAMTTERSKPYIIVCPRK